MIEPEDLQIPGISALQSKFEVSALATFDPAVANLITSRLTDLQSMPVRGVFDANHLQQIHVRIFQDAFPWAGQFRGPQPTSVTSSLDMLFDRLARENRLKGLDVDAWSNRAAEYFREIASIEPFIAGTDLAAQEFCRELASENNIKLRWTNALDEPSGEPQAQIQKVQSNNLRRILMLAVDSCPSNVRASRDLDRRQMLELIAGVDFL